MDRWLTAALDYIPRWLDFQLRTHRQPGCVIAITHRGRVVLEHALGHADLRRGVVLTPRHRFRVASHSKAFTAAGILKLREQGRLKLDDKAGRYVRALHPAIAEATIAQLLSHSAGIVRDGADTGQWLERRPFLSADELRADLALAPTIEANTRFKYSNHGYGLVGLVIEAVTGESYATWIKREIVDAAGLEETVPDVPLRRGAPFARGHSGELLLGRRVILSGDAPTHALAPATGFVSTAADLARFFAQLSPAAGRSVLSVGSRREMVRRQWRNPHSSLELYYGLGVVSWTSGNWEWFGHTGAFPGYLSRTATLWKEQISVSVLTNAIDGPAEAWAAGVGHILQACARNGAPSRRLKDWRGRWWSLWGATDLVPVGNKVLAAAPALFNPFMDASEIEITGRDRGRIALANGFASHGQPVRLLRNKAGKVAEVYLAGSRLVPGSSLVKEMTARYGKR